MKRGFLNSRKAKNSTTVIDSAGGTAASTTAELEKVQSLPSPVEGLAVAGNFTLVETDSGRLGAKMPIGKLDATLPKDYVPLEHKAKVYDAKTVDYTDQHIVFTRICPDSDKENFPDGPNISSECLFQSGKQKRTLLSIPNFPLPVSRPPQTRHRIGPSAHGIGMFATRDLAPNDLIYAERPLLVTPKAMGIGCAETQNQLTPEQVMKALLEEYERLLQVCVGRMPPENRAAFFELHNCHTEDGSGPILGRSRTNGIGFSVAGKDVKKEERDFYYNTGTFAVASRMNHSCTPNVSYYFHIPSFSLRLHAIRPIKAGEELLISYTQHSMPKAERQTRLRPYGFECACDACCDPNGDTRLAIIMKSNTSHDGPPEKLMQDSLRWIKLIEGAKLESLTVYFSHLLRVALTANQLGKWSDAKKYEAMSQAWFSANHGEPNLMLNISGGRFR